jgi:hypothetical protein
LPNGNPAAAVQGHIRHHVKNGRFGFQTRNLYWTHVLHVEVGTDIRSDYSSQLNTLDPANADAVTIDDYPIDGVTTAFLVVMVTRKGRGTDNDHLMVFLDRAGKGGAIECCPGIQIPNQLFANFTVLNPFDGCQCLNGITVPITKDQITGRWNGNFNACGFANVFRFWCQDGSLGVNGFAWSLQCGGGSVYEGSIYLVPPDPACSPLFIQFIVPGVAQISNCCVTDAHLKVTITQ